MPIHEGTASSIPLPSGIADAVVAAQAFHWFANQESMHEIHRALKEGGHFALIWNTRDHAQGWQRELEQMIDGLYPSDVPRQQTGAWQQAFESKYALFGPLQHRQFSFIQQCTPEELAARVLSISIINSLPQDQKDGVRKRILDFFATHPDTAGKSALGVAHSTDVYWAQKL